MPPNGFGGVFGGEAVDGAGLDGVTGGRFFNGLVVLGEGVDAFDLVDGVALERLLPLLPLQQLLQAPSILEVRLVVLPHCEPTALLRPLHAALSLRLVLTAFLRALADFRMVGVVVLGLLALSDLLATLRPLLPSLRPSCPQSSRLLPRVDLPPQLEHLFPGQQLYRSRLLLGQQFYRGDLIGAIGRLFMGMPLMSLLPSPIKAPLCLLPYLLLPNSHFDLIGSHCTVFPVVFHDGLYDREKCSAKGIQLSDHHTLQTHPGVSSTLPQESQQEGYLGTPLFHNFQQSDEFLCVRGVAEEWLLGQDETAPLLDEESLLLLQQSATVQEVDAGKESTVPRLQFPPPPVHPEAILVKVLHAARLPEPSHQLPLRTHLPSLPTTHRIQKYYTISPLHPSIQSSHNYPN